MGFCELEEPQGKQTEHMEYFLDTFDARDALPWAQQLEQKCAQHEGR